MDIVDFERARDSLLIGYGLVVGLDGSGATLRNPDFTTARRITQAINAYLSAPAADVRDSATVVLRPPLASAAGRRRF